MNMSVKKRIKLLVKELNITVSAFEKSINASNGYVNSISKSVGLDKIESILENYSNLNLEWLLIGKGEMFKQETNAIQLHNTNLKIADRTMSNQDIPLYDFQATAGLRELFDSSKPHEVLDTIRIPNLPPCDGAISVTGDSMYPLLKSGDLILFKQAPTELNSIFFGEMYLLGVSTEFDEYITVKYVQKSTKGEEYVSLVSQNRHHEPKDIHLSQITALAMIKASIRFNTMF